MSELTINHDTKSSGIFKIALNLTVTCLVSGAIIAGVYYLTHPIAVQKEQELEIQSMKELVPEAATTEEVTGEEGLTAALDEDGSVIAYIVEVEPKGYGGAIDMLVAVTPDGAVSNFEIVSADETPGLGTKAAESPFKDQFSGKTSEELQLTKDSSEGTVEAITGATITSRAVTKGMKQAVDRVNTYVEEASQE